jgi:hypothetical protein
MTDMFGDLTLQESESHEIVELGTGHLPQAPVWVNLVNEAPLRHRLSELGKMDSNPMGDKADHT